MITITNRPPAHLRAAASRILDELETDGPLVLDVAGGHPPADGLAPLLEALHAEARRRGVGVRATPMGEGNALCLSLRRP